ncbi:hypothetical protein [Spiroplasma endosymbiont of Lariophagus distinguendus]|uniref:hypothetical protein n=1 Tax=Spiroplasma endosymbiont of Lariophagus distinguendus TaxID=2935082 RepID=UPI00207970C6|nr:hypothetical protein [Spiroplasma endosymbiont of Lariophagus distinguendus]
MTKTRINWIYWGNEWYKHLENRQKEEIFCDFLSEEKISDAIYVDYKCFKIRIL